MGFLLLKNNNKNDPKTRDEYRKMSHLHAYLYLMTIKYACIYLPQRLLITPCNFRN